MGWRRRSLRARLLLVSVFALVIGLLAGGLTLVGVLNFALQRSVTAQALQTADGVRKLVEQHSLSQPIPANPDMQVQVVDAQGRVVGASATADRLVAMLVPAQLARMADRSGTLLPGDGSQAGGPVRVVLVRTGAPTDPVYVLVARSTADVTHGVRLLTVTLLIAFPLLVVVLTAVSWRVLGAALRPVDALRAGAEEIAGAPGQAGKLRLPEPGSGDEIHRLAVTLNDMLGRLAAARARQRSFVADAAHELRSPLAAMRTELEVAQHLPADHTDWAALSTDLLTDVERLSRLVDDLLLLARADDASTRPARDSGPVDVNELLRAVVARYPRAELTNPPESLTAVADADDLARVVANLLDNASRHAASRVVVSASADGSDVLVRVADDGPGIAPTDRERVFGRFTRLDDARARDAGGSGLGLAIVRELVRRHSGTITLGDAQPGLDVTVRLPRG